MTDDADPDVLDEALRRRLLAYADDCARDIQATASRVTLVATTLKALFEVTGSGSPTDTTQVWALAVEAGSEPFIHARLGPAHPKRGLLLVVRRSDLQLVQRGVGDEPFDLAPLGQPDVLRGSDAAPSPT